MADGLGVRQRTVIGIVGDVAERVEAENQRERRGPGGGDGC
jgi:hypothetical protein